MFGMNLFNRTLPTLPKKTSKRQEENMTDVHMLTLKGRNVDSDIKGHIFKAKHQRTKKKKKRIEMFHFKMNVSQSVPK